MRVLILYNLPLLGAGHANHESETEILETVAVVHKHLLDAGHDVRDFGIGRDPRTLFQRLEEERPDVVFNLFEGLADHYETETYLAGLLDWLGVPYTGCPVAALTLARNKPLTKYLLQGAGLPTSRFQVIDRTPITECDLTFPVITKPAAQDASVGMDQGSVVVDLDGLSKQAQRLIDQFGAPIIAEEFVYGRELNVSLIEVPELKLLPISEILFVDKDPNFWPIVTYDAKWKPGTRDYESTPPLYPAPLTPRIADRIGVIARQAFRLLGCRDYARVDFRLKANGKPFIIEVNPNPDYHPDAGLAAGLQAAGLSHAQLSVELVQAALLRGLEKNPAKADDALPPKRKKNVKKP